MSDDVPERVRERVRERERRPWYREPETFVAVAALVVSISAVVVGVYEASLQRAHDRAEVWPHLELETFTTGDGATVTLENTGLGPAIVQYVYVTVDRRPQRDWLGALGALLGRSPTAYTNATVVDHALRGGEKTTLVGMRRDDLPTPFWRQIARVAVDVCYASVFGEHWALHALLGSRNSWRPVNACPAQPTGTDF